MNNFASMGAIAVGLGSSSISRLTKTMAEVPQSKKSYLSSTLRLFEMFDNYLSLKKVFTVLNATAWRNFHQASNLTTFMTR